MAVHDVLGVYRAALRGGEHAPVPSDTHVAVRPRHPPSVDCRCSDATVSRPSLVSETGNPPNSGCEDERLGTE